jgi:hypothetical protein
MILSFWRLKSPTTSLKQKFSLPSLKKRMTFQSALSRIITAEFRLSLPRTSHWQAAKASCLLIISTIIRSSLGVISLSTTYHASSSMITPLVERNKQALSLSDSRPPFLPTKTVPLKKPISFTKMST